MNRRFLPLLAVLGLLVCSTAFAGRVAPLTRTQKAKIRTQAHARAASSIAELRAAGYTNPRVSVTFYGARDVTVAVSAVGAPAWVLPTPNPNPGTPVRQIRRFASASASVHASGAVDLTIHRPGFTPPMMLGARP